MASSVSPSAAGSLSSTRRACDACRRRKIRCDGAHPCATCQTAQHVCSYEVPPRKRGPKTSHATASPLEHKTKSPEFDETYRHNNSELYVGISRQSWFTSVGRAHEISRGLANSLQELIPSLPVIEVVRQCVDYFLQFSFTSGPTIHEKTIREEVKLLFATESPGLGFERQLVSSMSMHEGIAVIRSFTLLATICAVSIAVGPKTGILNFPRAAAISFYESTRDMMRLIEEYDIENPDSYSLRIRMFQSSACQTLFGQPGMTKHFLAEAQRMAKDLRLHDENCVSRYPEVESQLLRNCFWLLWTSDQSAQAFCTRSSSLHYAVLDSNLTLEVYARNPAPLLDPENPCHRAPFEEKVLLAFHYSRRMRTVAARLIQGVRGRSRIPRDEECRLPPAPQESLENLIALAAEYNSFPDHMPPWIKDPDICDDAPCVDSSTVKQYQRDAFLMQKTHLLLTFHALRLVILHQCIEHGLLAVIDLDHSHTDLPRMEVDIGKDFVQVLEEVPFQCVAAIGEPGVEILRRVGAVLLEISQRADATFVREQAATTLSRLLDVLSHLDSAASDALFHRQR